MNVFVEFELILGKSHFWEQRCGNFLITQLLLIWSCYLLNKTTVTLKKEIMFATFINNRIKIFMNKICQIQIFKHFVHSFSFFISNINLPPPFFFLCNENCLGVGNVMVCVLFLSVILASLLCEKRDRRFLDNEHICWIRSKLRDFLEIEVSKFLDDAFVVKLKLLPLKQDNCYFGVGGGGGGYVLQRFLITEC